MIVCTQKSWFAIGVSGSIIMWCIERDEFSPDVDLDRDQSVVIWCVRFGVAFGAAELA